MRFMECSFEQALEAMIGSAEVTDHYQRYPPDSILHLRYADITGDPSNVARSVSMFCDVRLTELQVRTIVERFDKANVRRLINEKEADIQRRARAGEPIGREEVVPQRFRSGIVRAFDTNTGFQSGHVTDCRDADWRTLLTEEQQVRMHAELREWLRRNGYAVEDEDE